MDKLLCILSFVIYFISFVTAKYYGYQFYQNDLSPINEQNFDYQIPDNSKYEKTFHLQNAHSPEEQENWPDPSVVPLLGQVSGVATGSDGNVRAFHRGDVVWDESSFDDKNVYKHQSTGPISNDTILILDSESGKLIKSWGGNKFYMPHGISIDPQGNVWLTDVALHQVFRFKRDQYEKPDLVLGEKFVPGDDEKHFCKPTDVAIASTGIIYISDGYCNSRVLIFSPDGNLIGQIGMTDGMIIPHSITLLEHENLICVADRENRRILCYTAGLNGDTHFGKLVFNILHPNLNRVFAIDHIGDILMAVNGPDAEMNSQPHGICLDLATEELVSIWEPKSGKFEEPHDISVAADGQSFYVSDISTSTPKRIYKFNM